MCLDPGASRDDFLTKIKADFKGIVSIVNAFIEKYSTACEDPAQKFMPVLSESTPLDERGACVDEWNIQCTLTQRASVIRRPASIVCGDPDYDKIVVPSVASANIFGKRKASCTALVGKP